MHSRLGERSSLARAPADLGPPRRAGAVRGVPPHRAVGRFLLPPSGQRLSLWRGRHGSARGWRSRSRCEAEGRGEEGEEERPSCERVQRSPARHLLAAWQARQVSSGAGEAERDDGGAAVVLAPRAAERLTSLLPSRHSPDQRLLRVQRQRLRFVAAHGETRASFTRALVLSPSSLATGSRSESSTLSSSWPQPGKSLSRRRAPPDTTSPTSRATCAHLPDHRRSLPPALREDRCPLDHAPSGPTAQRRPSGKRAGSE